MLQESRAVNRFLRRFVSSDATVGQAHPRTGAAGVSASPAGSGTGADGVDYRWRTHRWPAQFSSTFS